MTDLVRTDDKQLVAKVSKLDRQIVEGIQMINTAWQMLAGLLYDFNEQRGWELLGYEQGQAGLNTWLAEPDRGMQRRHYFRLIEMHRELVVARGVGADTLGGIEVSKAIEVLPAIKAGRVSVEEALADAREMGWRDLREDERYGGAGRNGHDADPAELHECPICGKSHRSQ